jgi:hypothetical protein
LWKRVVGSPHRDLTIVKTSAAAMVVPLLLVVPALWKSKTLFVDAAQLAVGAVANSGFGNGGPGGFQPVVGPVVVAPTRRAGRGRDRPLLDLIDWIRRRGPLSKPTDDLLRAHRGLFTCSARSRSSSR